MNQKRRYKLEKVFSWSGGEGAIRFQEIQGIFVRPSLQQKGYRIINRRTRRPLKGLYETRSEALKALRRLLR
jgi:hypothetical protein